ncbi:MAG TPA: hypothetical protein ENI61_00430 [Ignavibacteria bacterium]|nr:hypothetical protein [Ignavibacteria bacterium]
MNKFVVLLLSAVLALSGISKAQNKSGFPKVKIHGLAFGDFFYNVENHNPSLMDLNGVNFRRIYFTGDFIIANNFSSRFRLETDYIGRPNRNELGVMVKDAWLKWHNIFKGSDLVFGLSPTPAFDVSEAVWGHRYLEKTIMDLNHIVGSRDLGIDLKGNFNQSGSLKYWVKLGNNSGNKAEANKFKRYYGLLEFIPSSNFLIVVYGDFASADPIVDPYDDQSKNNNSVVGALFLNYKEKGIFSLGFEGFIRSTQNGVISAISPSESLQGRGISIWAYTNLSKVVQLVARYDNVNLNTDASNDGKSLILAGVQFNPTTEVSITPNIEVFSYQSGVKSDVIPRITFYLQF